MSQTQQPQPQPQIQMTKSPSYGESYSNSVQVRVSVWDFFVAFGLVHQDSPEKVTIETTHGVYLSPQQAKALWNVLGQNLAQYEQTFGTISLEPQGQQQPLPVAVPRGPIH